MSQIKRATCVEELLALLENVFNDQNTNFDEFKQRPDDIIISPFAKSGTTWLQQSLHGIRSRGDMNFSEITDVSPWLEAAKIGDWNLNAEQAFQPRLFKSHLPFNQSPKGTKYVCSLRNPFSQLLSFYRFFEDWWFEKDSISIGEFARGIMLRDIANRGYWYHLCSWWKERHNPNVLLLCYENMISDLEKTIIKISAFMISNSLSTKILSIPSLSTANGFEAAICIAILVPISMFFSLEIPSILTTEIILPISFSIAE